MVEKKTAEQIEAEILKEAAEEAKKEKKAPEKKAEKKRPEKKKGVVETALETVKTLRTGKEEEEKPAAIKLERVYTVPLRSEITRTKRTQLAVSNLRRFIKKHTKAKEIKIEQAVNEKIWAAGYQKPPAHLRVLVQVDEDNIATVKLK